MPAIINSGTNGDLNPGLDGNGPVATAVGIVRKTVLTTSLGTALSAQVSYGWDQVSGEARILLPTEAGAIGDSVSVTFGCTPGTVAQRFAGTLVGFDTTLAPHAVIALCKGPLYALEEYENPVETINAGDGSGRPGLAFEDLVGASSATLKQIVTAVLGTVGVTYSASNLADPGHVYGTLAPEEFTWGTHETAAAYLHRLLEASAGYRLFDSADGNVYLKQISVTDGIGAEVTFTVGIDIFGDTQKTSTRIGRRSAVLVEGYDDGTGPATSGLIGSGSIYHVTSPLIETDAFATDLANFWLTQLDRNQEIVRLHTPSDALIGPAQLHFISGVAADTMWVKSVTTEVGTNGEVTQHPIYVAGI